MEYTIKTINELCTKITDGSHFSPEHETDGLYPMYSVKDMEYNNFSNADCKMIGQAMFDKLSKADCRPLKNDILIAKDGSYLKCAFKVNEDLNACILSSIAILRPNLKNIDPDYFVYLMRTKSIKGAMANYVSGSALPRIILSDFKKMKLKMILSLPTQQKIASILSAYDNLIQNYKKQIEALQTAASELYKEWFVRFRFPGYQSTRFENGIPEGWKVDVFSKYSTIMSGGTPSTEITEYYNGDIPFFTPKDWNEDFFSFRTIINITEEGLKHCNSQLYPKDTVIITARGTVGNVILLGVPMAMNQSCFALKSDVLNSPYYLFFVIKNEVLKLKKMANGGVFDTIIIKTFDHIHITIPDNYILSYFNKQIEPMMNRIYTLQQQITNLTQQRDLLLPRLMSGKLEI